MASTFGATVGRWARDIPEALEAVFKESAQELVRQLDDEIMRQVYDQPESRSGYKRTGFLRASLVASTQAMPGLVRDNPGTPVSADHTGPIILVINSLEGGQTLYLGYTAKYGRFVHVGANGVPPKPWVTLVAQRWREIVAAKAADVRRRFGL